MKKSLTNSVKIKLRVFKVFVLIAFLATSSMEAQVNLTDGSSVSKGPNSALELESSNKGLLIPRVTIASLKAFSQEVIVASGAEMIGTGGTIALYSNLSNHGTFVNSNNNIVLAGNDMVIEGAKPVHFDNMSVKSGSNVTAVSGGQTIKGILLCDGILNAGGNFLLTSDSAATVVLSCLWRGIVKFRQLILTRHC